MEVHPERISNGTSPIQCLKVWGSSLTDVSSSSAVYHFVVDSTGLAVNADFIFCDIRDNTKTTLLGAAMILGDSS